VSSALEGATLIHGAVARGDLIERQDKVEDLAGIDLAAPDEVSVALWHRAVRPLGQPLSLTGEMATPPAQGMFGFKSDLTDV
jgi:hypothetical protein